MRFNGFNEKYVWNIKHPFAGITKHRSARRAVHLRQPERGNRDRGQPAGAGRFSIKGANSLISQLTDDDLGTNSGVNIRSHALRFEYGLAKKVTLQSLVFIQNELRNSGQFPSFSVPLNAFTPRQYHFQEQMVFSF